MSNRYPLDQHEILQTGGIVAERIPGAPRQRADVVRLGADLLRHLRPYDPERDGPQMSPESVPRSQAECLEHTSAPTAAAQTALRMAADQQNLVDANRAAAQLAARTVPQQLNSGREWY